MERPQLLHSFTSSFFGGWGFGISGRNKDLKVLICTANAGNAEPSLNSVKAWIPEDGSMDAVMEEKKYEVDMDSLFKETQYDNGRYGAFDVIVVGMQEATFHTHSKGQKHTEEQENTFDDLWAKHGEKTKDDMKDEKHSIPKFIGMNMNESKTIDDNNSHLNGSLVEETAQESEHNEVNIQSCGRICNNLGSGDSNSDGSPPNFAIYRQPGFKLKKVSFEDNLMVHQPSMRTITSAQSFTYPFEGSKDSDEFSDIDDNNYGSHSDEKNGHEDDFSKKEDSDDDGTKESIDEIKFKNESNRVIPKIESKDGSGKKKKKYTSLIGIINSSLFQIRSNTRSQNQIAKRNIFGSDYSKDSKILFELVSNRCPKYNFVVRYLYGSIRLMILVRNRLVKEVKDVRCKAVSTGIGSLLKNKGGIVASMTIRKTRLAFISAHLAAHEGWNYYFRRNHDIRSILDGGKIKHLDASLTNHHCFVFGDLNYRLRYPTTHAEPARAANLAAKYIQEKKFKELNSFDELRNGLLKEEVMVGFVTPQCLFPPTFKVERGAGFKYQSQRSPSYTDRILWSSTKGLENYVRPILYEAVEDYITSDHKPIRGAFIITTNATKTTLVNKIIDETSHFLCCSRKKLKYEDKEKPKKSGISRIYSARSSNISYSISISLSNFCCSNMRKYFTDDASYTYYLKLESIPENMFSHHVLEKASSSRSLTSILTQAKTNTHAMATISITCDYKKYLNWGEQEIKVVIRDSNKIVGALCFVSLVATHIRKQDCIVGTAAIDLQGLCKLDDVDEESNEKDIFYDSDLNRNGQKEGHICFSASIYHHF